MAKYKKTITFSIGQSQTDSVFLNERAVTGLIVSDNVITGSLVSFLVSVDNTNFYPLFDNNSAEITLTVSTTPTAYSLSPEFFMAWDFIKARLGTSASPVNQVSAAQDVILITDSM